MFNEFGTMFCADVADLGKKICDWSTAKRVPFQQVAIILCLKLYLIVLARNSKIKGQIICLGTEMLQGTVW